MMGQRSSQRVNSAPALASTTEAEEDSASPEAAARSHSEALPSSSSPPLDPESEFEVISIDGDSTAVDDGADNTFAARRP